MKDKKQRENTVKIPRKPVRTGGKRTVRVCISVPKALWEKTRKYPDVNWSAVASESFGRVVETLKTDARER